MRGFTQADSLARIAGMVSTYSYFISFYSEYWTFSHIGCEEVAQAQLGEQKHNEVRGPGHQPGQHHHRAHRLEPLHWLRVNIQIAALRFRYLFSFFNERSDLVLICPFLGAELKHGIIVVPEKITIIYSAECVIIMCVTCDGCWWWRGCGPWPGWAPATRWWPAPRCRTGGPGPGSGSQWCCSPGSPGQCNIFASVSTVFQCLG